MKCKTITSAVAALLLLAPLAIGQDGSNTKSGSSVKTMVAQTPTLKSLLDENAAKGAKMLPPEIMAKIKDGIKAASESGVLESAKKVGDAAPDATLTNFNGESVQLSTLWQQGPIVLMWYRGGW